jgi:uncharacterized membrane protein/protein-disulfide isomerase
MSMKLFDPAAGPDLSVFSSVPGSQAAAPLCSARLAAICRLLCLAGLCISGYLAWTALQMQPVFGCGSGGIVDCSHVLNSRWSKVGGMPVSIPAVALYGSLLALLSFVRRPAPVALQQSLWAALAFGFLAAGLAAVWFISIQLGVLRHICPWCMAAHTCSLILAGIALGTGHINRAVRTNSIAGAILAVGLLAGMQLSAEEAPTFEEIEPAYVQQPAAAAEEFSPAAEEAFVPPSGAEEFGPPSSGSVPAEEFAPPAESFDPPSAASGSQASLIAPLLFSLQSTQFVYSVLPPSAASDERVQAGDSSKLGDAAGAVQKETAAPSEPRRITIAGASNPITLQPRFWPMIGADTAEYIFVEMFDYTCPHCRENHDAVKAVVEQFGGKVSVVTLPVPLERSCNRYASGGGHAGACELSRLAVAVWLCDPQKFAEFHDWMMDSSRTPETARRRAQELVGRDALQAKLDSGEPAGYVDRHVTLYQKAGAGSVPKLLFSTSSTNGKVQKEWLRAKIGKELQKVAVR